MSELKICSDKKHNPITYNDPRDIGCPLCKSIDWSNKLHDFIESNGYTNEWVDTLIAEGKF